MSALKILKKSIPPTLINQYHLALAFLGNKFYGSPSKKLILIGVTGTKGKTTVAYLIWQILEKNNLRSALSSTVFLSTGGDKERNLTKMGMPGRFFLPRLLRRALQNQALYGVVETSSEGILQHRQKFLDYDTVVFNNLSPEHIERHGGFKEYRQEKEKLFKQCAKNHVLNLGDPSVRHFLKYPARSKWGVLLEQPEQNGKYQRKISPTEVNHLIEGKLTEDGLFCLKEWLVMGEFQKKLIFEQEHRPVFEGRFNLLNLLLAYAALRSLDLPPEKIVEFFRRLKLPPGRIQEIKSKKIDFRIFLDYAHEPLSLKSVLEYGREILPPKKKLICLIGGQGGGRDRWKRGAMGELAGRLCDKVIIGLEDPYEEDPEQINQDILAGVLKNSAFQLNKNVWTFSDRRKALEKALKIARPGYVVILCGKGGEKKMCVGDKTIRWDEEKEIKQIIQFL